MAIKLKTPLDSAAARALRAGDMCLLTGELYTARDAAHKRLCTLLEAGQPLPFDMRGAVIYFVGPTPAKPGQAIGSAGPTTSYRMDAYSPALLFENISGWWEVAQICVSALLGIFAIAASLNGHLYKKVHWVLRIVLAVGGLGMMIPGTLTDVAGLVLVLAVIFYQRVSAKKGNGPVVAA